MGGSLRCAFNGVSRFGPLTIEKGIERPIQSSRRQLAPFWQTCLFTNFPNQSTESPIYFVHAGPKPRFSKNVWDVSTRFGYDPLKSTSKMRSQQPSTTRPLFRTNLRFRQLVETVNYEFRLKLFDKCLKWRFVRKRGRPEKSTHRIVARYYLL